MAPTLEEWLVRNAEWAKDFKPVPTFKQLLHKDIKDVASATIFLTCADPRVVPEDMFNMAGGVRAGVVRNAGGRAFDALRSIETLHALVALANVVVIHHTDCGLVNFHNDYVREELAKIDSSEASKEYLNNIDNGEILEIDASIREDVALLKRSPFLKDVKIVGYKHDDATGKLTEVK